MIPEYQERIGIRLSKEERQRIERVLEKGKHKTISEVVRVALERFLEGECV